MSSPFARDPKLLDYATEKARDVYPKQKRPWRACTTLKHHTTSAESHFLYTLARDQGPGNYADLGCLWGGSSATIGHGLEEAKGGSVYSVDYFGTGPEQDTGVSGAPKKIEEYFSSAFKKTDVTICKGTTKAFSHVINVPFKGVFIDACHCHVHSKEDWDLWSPKVVVGGYVAFHDCHFDGVAKTISEVDLTKWEFIRKVFSIVAFRRVG